MPLARILRTTLAGLAAWIAMASPVSAQTAQTYDKVSIGTNWVAEAEHGGFYQALADGTYRKYGLDVNIVQGGPNTNNRILLPVGKLDFYLSANTLQGFDAVTENIPTVEVAALFQKDPQVLLAHPDPAIQKFTDLKNLTLFVSKEGMATYFQWLKADYGFSEFSGQTLHVQSAAIPGGQKERDAGLCDLGAVRHREGRALQAQSLSPRRPGLFHLFDVDRDAARSGRQKSRLWCSGSSMPRSSAGTITSTAETRSAMN